MRSFIESLKASSVFGHGIVFHHYMPPREAHYAEPSAGLNEKIVHVLRGLNIQRLYSHQAQALDQVRQGNSVVVATPTASGKTLIYSLPVLEDVLKDTEATALYLFPLKALEQDQWRALKEMTSFIGSDDIVSSAIYDGDTAPHLRKKIKANPPNILITNPDMLHMGLLAFHSSWEQFFARLKYIIIDEVHTYRGVFGSHMAQVIRRLNRVCGLYGSSPAYLLSSGTVANPLEFCGRLIGRQPFLIDENGAPSAGRHFLFMNPDTSAGITSALLLIRCIREGLRTIVFTQSRKVTELIHMWATQMAPEMKNKISSYRAGFLPEERRVIERGLSAGRLLGVISTSALEMGIDVGGLDVCILVGYPGTMITTWQRGGRVGRGDRESMIALVAQPDALDQYFMRHPDRFFEQEYESAVLDPNNRDIVKAHIPCAAAEEPLADDDAYFSSKLHPVPFEQLENAARILRGADRPVWYAAQRSPHREVNLRSIGETHAILDAKTKRAIGSIDGFRALKECHPGAIYLHKATQFEVEALDVSKHNIFVNPVEASYYTKVLTEKETEILEIHRSRPEGNFLVKQGQLKVTERVTGFEKRRIKGQELISRHDLSLPEQVFETVGMWIEIEELIKRTIEQRGLHFMGGIHAVEHALISMFPLLVLCDRNDVGGISYPFHPEVGKSAVFIYDGYPGGVGLAEKGFDYISELLEKTLELISSCDCEEGCPACIHSPKCGSGNKPLDKTAAQIVLELLLGRTPLESNQKEPRKVDEKSKKPDVVNEERRLDLRFAVLDIETQRSAQEVGGWQNTHLMRVSVAVLYDSEEDAFHTYFEQDVGNLINQLKSYELIVGFNIKRFDYKVLEAYARPGEMNGIPTFDILEYVNKKLGYRLSLDHLAQKTLNAEKSGSGLLALEWYKKGLMQKLAEYCRNDVVITRDLFLFGLEQGHLVFENREGHLLRMATRWDVKKLKEGVWE